MADYTAIVIGAGIEGSATAYHLAKNGHKTLLLEQFPLPHSRGSSHGQSRIIRKSYKDQIFADMMHDAYAQWRHLERDTNTKLIEDTGYLLVGTPSHPELTGSETALRTTGANFEKLTAFQTRKRFPKFSCDDCCHAIYESSGGSMRADKCLQAYWQMFQRLGGTLHDNEQVVLIEPGESVRVKTNKCIYVTSDVVITAGPWTSRLTRPLGLNLPLQPIKINVCYWKVETDAYSARKGFPVFAIVGQAHGLRGTRPLVYGVPALEYPGHIKVCLHAGHNIDADTRDTPTDSWDITALKRIVTDFFPEAQPTPSLVETCIYTMTPDEHFILDRHPAWKNIVIGAGFSGTGFKLAPVVGRLLAEMVTGREPSHDLHPFRMTRFPGLISSGAKL